MENKYFKELRKDHDIVDDILKQMGETGDKACQAREKLVKKLKMELLPHIKAEDIVMYIPMKKHKEVKEDALEAMQEHHVTEMVLTELVNLPCDDENWMAKCKVFTELVEHHVEEEESVFFDAVEKAFTKEEIEQMHPRFLEEKMELRSELEGKPKAASTTKKSAETSQRAEAHR